ncbi:MAG: NlpC/P60 family protein [Ilumatobacteraceae bacterium]
MRQLLRVFPVAVAIALIVPMMAPTVVQAQSVDGQRQKVEDIVDELERLEEKSNQLAESYVEAIDTKAQLDAEIVEAEARVAAKEAELTELRGSLSEMALRSFVGGGAAPLGPLFEDSTNLNDVLQRDELARIALSAGDVTSDELDALVSDLEAEKADLDAKREQAEQLAESLVAAQEQTEQQTDDYEAARTEAEQTLGELIAEEEARRAAESLRQMQAQAAQAQAAHEAANSGNNSGGNNSGGGGGTGGGGTTGGTSESGGGETYTPAPAVSSRSGIAISAAMAQQGVPYRYAASSPGEAFDCSGLTAYAWAQAGVGLPHQSRAQYASVPHVSQAEAQPGDLLFYYSPISHVGIYLGGGQLVHAPNTGSSVKVAAVNWSKVTGVGRPG